MIEFLAVVGAFWLAGRIFRGLVRYYVGDLSVAHDMEHRGRH